MFPVKQNGTQDNVQGNEVKEHDAHGRDCLDVY